MESNWKKDWWESTKKDFKEFVDAIPFLASVIWIIYFVVFRTPERMALAQAIIDSGEWVVITCIAFGILTIAAGLEKIVRFIITTLWFVLSMIGSYILKQINK